MKVRPKSFFSALQFGRVANSPATAAVGGNGVVKANLQSLASELNESAIEGVSGYPRNWVLIARALAGAFAVLALTRFAVLILAILQAPNGILAGLLSWNTLGIVLSMAIAIGAAGFFANLFPTIRATPQGFGVDEITGWRRVPWEQVGVLRVMEMESKGRFVVFIPFTGETSPNTPAPMLQLIPWLAGAAKRGERGVLITSDIKNFDRLLQLILTYMMQAEGRKGVRAQALIDEQVVMPLAQLVLDPEAAIMRLAKHRDTNEDPYGVTAQETEPHISMREALMRQLPLAAVPALLLAVELVVRNGMRGASLAYPIWMVVIIAVGIAELPFAAKIVQTVGETMVGSGYFMIGARAYLEIQLPRALLVAVAAVLLGLGLPIAVAQSFWLAGIVLTSLITTRFVQRLYYLPVSNTALAGVGTFIMQAFIMGIYLAAH